MSFVRASIKHPHRIGFGRSVIRVLCSILIGSWLSLFASAQDGADLLDRISGDVSAISAVEGDETPEQMQALDLLAEARSEVETALRRTATVDEYVQISQNSRDIIEELDELIASQSEQDIGIDVPDSANALRSRLNALQRDRDVRNDTRSELLDTQTVLTNRSSAIANELALARGALNNLDEIISVDATTDESTLGRARQTLTVSRLFARQSEVDDLRRELQTVPERQLLVATRIDLADVVIAGYDGEIETIQTRLSKVRADRADEAIRRAELDLAEARRLVLPEVVIADENLGYARMLEAMSNDALNVDREAQSNAQLTLRIQRQAETVDRIVATGRITTEASTLLRQLRSSLPSVLTLRTRIDETVEARAATQLNLVLWQDKLSENELRSDTVGDRVNGSSASDDELAAMMAEAQLSRSLVDHQRILLEDLIGAGREQADRLTNKEVRLSETLIEAQELQNTLDRSLLWLPSNVRPVSNLRSRLTSAVNWILDPSSLSFSLSKYVNILKAFPILIVLIGLLATLCHFSRRRLQNALTELNEDVGKVARDRYGTTAFALGVCLLLALPVPGIILAATLPVLVSSGGDSHLSALVSGLVWLAVVIWMAGFIRQASADKGVLEIHFHWVRKARQLLRSTPVWMSIVFALSVFLLASAMASHRSDVEHSFGMIALLMVSSLFATASYRIFSLDNGLIRQISKNDRNGGYLLLGQVAFSLTPLIIGVLPFFGYFDTAMALQIRLFSTAAFLIGLCVFYGILWRATLIAQHRFVLRRAREHREKRAEEKRVRLERGGTQEEGDKSEEPDSFKERIEAERKRVTGQTLRLLFYLVASLAVVGLIAIWGTVLPALGVANDIVLWSGVETINGVQSTRPVTLWNLFLFFLFIIAGTVAATNIRGLIEIGPLQRLRLSAGSRFTIHTVIGYILIGTGIVAGFLQLGVDWSRLQWIIAALGVGLGFGLQEIVANFISGLIILFERPVRVGDTVTIGDLEGDVTNIAIRATTIKDFDNREVLLPNKSIITENVTNWTLSDTIMRIIIDIGVAYGSDLEKVREVLFKVAADEPDVLDSPEPRLFFMKHGDSSLDYELRVFISSPWKRFRVRDRLNTEINRALAEAEIEIPFPQRDVHMR